ncbi:MAG: hypothetical protein ACR2JW_09705 [Thermomicrobiales bacterium]
MMEEREQERFVPEAPIYTFRARILGCMAGYAPEDGTEIQREIEIAANSTLGDLGFAILDAYDFDDGHLWSFFLSGKAWDRASEYSYQGSDWDGDDDLEDVLDLFPEGSEMRKLVLLVNDPDFEPVGDFPAAIDRTRLQTEIVTMLREAAAGAPEEDRPLMEEFAALIAANPDADPMVLSEALGRYLAEDWEPGAVSGEPDAIVPLMPDLDLAALDLPGLDFPLFDDDAPDVDEILIRDVPYPGKTGKKEFLFLFDYGDEWHFGVKLIDAKGKLTPEAEYPRVTASRGEAPPQYPPWDEDDDEEWEDEEGAEDAMPRTGTILHFDPKTGAVTREPIVIPPKKNGT